MPNSIKYSASAQTLALKKGNYWIGTGDVGKGPTSTTDYYNGITPPSGGYTIYLNKASGGPSIYTAANDTQLVSLTNTIIYIPTNYISNGGNFSNGTSSPFLYDYSGAGGVGQVVSIANDKPYVGSTSTNALELNYNGGKWMDTTGLLTVGQTYTFSFWAKVTSGSSFAIGWNNQNGSGDTNSWSSGGFTITTSWQRYSQVFTYNAARNQLYFSTRNQTVGTLAVFTEFQLSLGSAPCGPGLTTATESINWFLTQTDKMVFNADYPAIVTDGLVMNLDAGFTPSITSLPTNIVGGGYNSYTPTWYGVGSGGNNGTLTNGPTFNSANGGSIVFDGVDDYVPTSVSVTNWAIQPFTISSFFKWSTGASNANYGFFELAGGGGSNWGMSHVPRSGNFYFYWLKDGVNEGHVASSALIQDNVTLNITITFNGVPANSGQQTLYDNTKIYMNGVEVPHSAAGSAGVSSSSTLYVGGTQYPMKGNIYNFLYYTRPLSASEVLQNYNAQKSRFGL